MGGEGEVLRCSGTCVNVGLHAGPEWGLHCLPAVLFAAERLSEGVWVYISRKKGWKSTVCGSSSVFLITQNVLMFRLGKYCGTGKLENLKTKSNVRVYQQLHLSCHKDLRDLWTATAHPSETGSWYLSWRKCLVHIELKCLKEVWESLFNIEIVTLCCYLCSWENSLILGKFTAWAQKRIRARNPLLIP